MITQPETMDEPPNRSSTEFNGSGYDQSDVESLGCRKGGGRRGRAVDFGFFWEPS